MRSLAGLPVLVTGGSRGLGLGIVKALVARNANVTVLARGRAALDEVANRLGVDVIVADAAAPGVAEAALRDVKPSVTILNAGAVPPMGPIHKMSWSDFSSVWNQDVRAGLEWTQAAIAAPLPRGSRVLMGSSGAAIVGSPLSGGYAGAKRMLWLMATYGNGVSAELDLGIRFQALVPHQIIGGTGVGDAAASVYAAKRGMTQSEFLGTFGKPMDPMTYGEFVATLLEDPAADRATAFGISSDRGVVTLDS